MVFGVGPIAARMKNSRQQKHLAVLLKPKQVFSGHLSLSYEIRPQITQREGLLLMLNLEEPNLGKIKFCVHKNKNECTID